MTRSKTKAMVIASLIAAFYTALTLALAPISYGPVQMRLSEALTILPAYSPTGIVGVTLGCAVANLVGFLTGANILGALDILFGTLATLVAAMLSWLLRRVRFRGLPILAPLPPVLINAAFIGAELYVVMGAGKNLAVFWTQALLVGLGQLVPCYLLGLLLFYTLSRTGLDKKLLD